MVDIEGLWTAEFQSSYHGSSEDAATGVVVLTNGRLRGGDGSYYYVGTYKIEGGQIQCDVSVQHYSGPVGSIFGPIRSLRFRIDGSASEDLIIGRGYDPTQPSSPQIHVQLQKVDESLGE